MPPATDHQVRSSLYWAFYFLFIVTIMLAFVLVPLIQIFAFIVAYDIMDSTSLAIWNLVSAIVIIIVDFVFFFGRVAHRDRMRILFPVVTVVLFVLDLPGFILFQYALEKEWHVDHFLLDVTIGSQLLYVVLLCVFLGIWIKDLLNKRQLTNAKRIEEYFSNIEAVEKRPINRPPPSRKRPTLSYV
ncbi:hypothetical protein PCE1_001901 [Barthelona sp. PCE]